MFFNVCGDQTKICDGDFLTSTNICTYLNEYNIEQKQVEDIINLTIKRTVERFGKKEEIQTGLLNEKISLYFVEKIDESIYKGEDVLGVAITYYFSDTYVSKIDVYVEIEGKTMECFENYVLAHEILHVMDLYVTGLKEKIEREESHPEGFFRN